MGQRDLAAGKKGGVKKGVVFGFFDEAGFSDRPHVARTWGLKGETPIIRSRGGWTTITASGMVTFNAKTKRAGSLAWVSKHTMKKAGILSILRDLKRHYRRRRLVLVWDGLAARKAKVVKAFIEDNRRWLTVIRFPSYAPELNPQELAWSATKRADLGSFCPTSSKQPHRTARTALKRRSRKQAFLKGCLRGSGLFNARELGEG
jgi:transposase